MNRKSPPGPLRSLNAQMLVALGVLLLTFVVFLGIFAFLLAQIEAGRTGVEDEWRESHYAWQMARDLERLHDMIYRDAMEANPPNQIAVKTLEDSFRANLSLLRGHQEDQVSQDEHLQHEEDTTIGAIVEGFESLSLSLNMEDPQGDFTLHYHHDLEQKFRALQDDIDRFVKATDDEVGESIKTIGRAHGRFRNALVAWMTALLLMVTLFFIVFAAYFVLPIASLNRAVRRIAKRDFGRKIEIHRSNELGELAEAINAMAEELSQFTSRIESELERNQRLASLGRLAAGIAHEINNPLASIGACSEGLLKRWDGLGDSAPSVVDPTDREYLKLIRGEVQRCKSITEKLLGLSRERPTRFGPLNLAGVTRDVIDLIRHSPEGKKAAISFKEPEASVYSRGDGDQIKQVILNLMLNALDAIRDGGEILIRLESRKDDVCLVIEDTGTGMTPEELEQAFEPFFTTKGPGSGTGIGLTLSHAIVKSHQGELSARSPGRGKGSIFFLTLPKWRDSRDYRVAEETLHASV